MSIKMISPVGKKVMNIRKEDIQLYLGRGYKYVDEPADLETVEMMSPAGKVVIMKKDVGDYLNREGWSLLELEIPAEDETPEPPIEDEIPEKPVEDEIPVLPTDTAPVEEPELAAEQEPELEAEIESESEPVESEEAEETID